MGWHGVGGRAPAPTERTFWPISANRSQPKPAKASQSHAPKYFSGARVCKRTACRKSPLSPIGNVGSSSIQPSTLHRQTKPVQRLPKCQSDKSASIISRPNLSQPKHLYRQTQLSTQRPLCLDSFDSFDSFDPRDPFDPFDPSVNGQLTHRHPTSLREPQPSDRNIPAARIQHTTDPRHTSNPGIHAVTMAPMNPMMNNKSSKTHGEAVAREANVLASCYLVDRSASLKGLHYCTTSFNGKQTSPSRLPQGLLNSSVLPAPRFDIMLTPLPGAEWYS